MSKKLSTRAQALLDAQTEFWLHRLDGDGLEALLKDEIKELLSLAQKLKLEEAVSREAVKATALTYAADIEPSGAIPELVGEIAKAVQNHPAQDSTTLSDLMSDRQFKEWRDKLLELKDAREALIHAALSNPLVANITSDLLYRGIRGYLSESTVGKNIPGAASMLNIGKSLLSKAAPNLDQTLEETLRKYIHRSIRTTLRESEPSIKALLKPELLREGIDPIWEAVRHTSVAQLREPLSREDVEELFVIGYEHWRTLRKTAYYRAMIETGIDVFFDKYGKSTLAELLTELGIDREIMMTEAMRFAPQALKLLRKKKLLEPLIRRQLAPFFASPAAAALLAD